MRPVPVPAIHFVEGKTINPQAGSALAELAGTGSALQRGSSDLLGCLLLKLARAEPAVEYMHASCLMASER
jgi:hypothetical protein